MNLKQRKILHLLTISNGRKYSELYKHFSPDDKFAYHLKQTINNGLVNKRGTSYFLTRLGAWETQNFDFRNYSDKKLKIPINIFICRYNEKFLIREAFAEDKNIQKLHALPGIKAEWGKEYSCLFTDELKTKFGLTGIVAYRSTFHLFEKTSKGDVMFDDILIVFDVNVTNLYEVTKNSLWLDINEIKQLPNRHQPIDVFILDNNKKLFGIINALSNFNLRDEDL